MNTKDTVAVASRSFSKNDDLVKNLQSKYSSVIFNNFGKTLQGDELVKFLLPATKAIIGIEELTEPVLAKLSKLKVISKYGVGLNNLDLELLKKRNISVSPL